jgi:hypothetical protein
LLYTEKCRGQVKNASALCEAGISGILLSVRSALGVE